MKSFYDDFLESQMLEYRISGNLRIDRATDRILDFVCSESNVLDVGCGIGISAERVSGVVEEGHVWAFDISERNIWYAQETVDRSNITFFEADVSEDKQKIQEILDEPVDVVTLVDVIEHIPKKEHKELFRFLYSVMSDQSFVVLTYPSPQFQEYLKEFDPDSLQIIDQVIDREKLLRTVQPIGFSLRHYSLETIWKRNQYVHCVLQTDRTLGEPRCDQPSFVERIQGRLQKLVRPLRRWKYIHRVFNGGSPGR